MKRRVLKPPALVPGSRVAVVSPASAAEPASLRAGCDELLRLGYTPLPNLRTDGSEGYFAASSKDRANEFLKAKRSAEVDAIFCARGGYGSTYLMDHIENKLSSDPKILLGYSDATTLQAYFWERFRWITFYGPMVAAGFDAGSGKPRGYDPHSFNRALTQAKGGWAIELQGESLSRGNTEGRLLGGCLTLVEMTIGTPWELDTADAILLLEDRGMKPYQVDRALMHLKQAGKLARVRGIILGEFPECDPPASGGPTVREVCRRILGALDVPVVWGVPIGHTPRPMLTIPLGVRARLRATVAGHLDILEPAVSPPARI